MGSRGDGPVAVAALIVTQRAEHGIPYATSCRALGVSPAWFYKWRDGDVSLRRARRRALAELIRAPFAKHRGTYGSPRITADLREAGWRVSEKTVASIMAELGLVARPKRRRRQLTRPGRGRWRAPDLVGRKFHASKEQGLPVPMPTFCPSRLPYPGGFPSACTSRTSATLPGLRRDFSGSAPPCPLAGLAGARRREGAPRSGRGGRGSS